MRPPRRSRDSGFIAVSAALVVATVSVLALVAAGHPRTLVGLGDGGAWVRSFVQGTIQHINGPSGSVDSSLKLPGDLPSSASTEVVNVGPVAVIHDKVTGRYGFINAPSLDIPTVATGTPGDEADIVGGAGVLYSLNRSTGQVAHLDPSLSVTGKPLSLSGPTSKGAVDASGVLWVGLPSAGAAASISTDTKTGALHQERAKVGAPGDAIAITVVDGHPYALDRSRAVLVSLRPGSAGTTVGLPDGGVVVLASQQGATTDGWVSAAVTSTATVVRVDPHSGHVAKLILNGRSGHDLGGVLGNGSRVVIPDYTTGDVLIVVPSNPPLVNAVHVSQPGHFDIEVKDGSIFANDPTGPSAVVVQPDGTPTNVDKYQLPPRENATPTPPIQTPPKPVPGPTGAPNPTLSPTPKPAPTQGPAGVPNNAATRPPPLVPVAPGAPGNVAALSGNGDVSLSWSAASDGGSPLTGYVVSGGPGDQPVGANATGFVVKGLTNEKPYTFSVKAVNAVGTGPAATASPNPITPHSLVPGAPGSVSATAGDTQVQVSWSAAATNGTTIAGYDVAVSDSLGGGPPPWAVGQGATSAVVTGLTNGVAYAVTVTANAANGASTSAGAPARVIPAGKPKAVVGASATGGDGSATVSFDPAASNGATVTAYTVVASPGGAKANVTPTASRMSVSVGGLTNGTPYTFTITATNKLGTGPAVTTNQVIPAGVPIVNISSTGLVGDGRTIRVNFSVNANGSQVTSCHAVASGVADQPGGCGGIDVSVPNWSTAYDVYAYVTTAGGLTGTSSHVGVTTGAQPCAQWSGYAQNQWPPAGATIRNVPDKAGASVGGISGNTPITFDKWTVGGAAPFPGNPVPYNSNQWLHLADGRGWVSYAGTRATQMTYVASGGGPPGPAVPLPPECRV